MFKPDKVREVESAVNLYCFLNRKELSWPLQFIEANTRNEETVQPLPP